MMFIEEIKGIENENFGNKETSGVLKENKENHTI